MEAALSSAATATMPVTSSVMMTMDEEDMTAEARQCVSTLREGKRCCPAPCPLVDKAQLI